MHRCLLTAEPSLRGCPDSAAGKHNPSTVFIWLMKAYFFCNIFRISINQLGRQLCSKIRMFLLPHLISFSHCAVSRHHPYVRSLCLYIPPLSVWLFPVRLQNSPLCSPPPFVFTPVSTSQSLFFPSPSILHVNPSVSFSLSAAPFLWSLFLSAYL